MTIKDFFSFRFKPAEDTTAAFGTLLLLWGAYWVGNNLGFASEGLNDVIWFIVFFMIGNFFLGVFFPAMYVTHERFEPLTGVGINGKGWLPALVISLIAAAVLLFLVIPVDFASLTGDLPRLALALLAVWQPFFFHGWLQQRFDRAFGTIPAIILTALAFALIRIGTFETMGGLQVTFLVGLVMAITFSLTRNILAVWPLAWLVVGVQEFAALDASVGWGRVILYVVLFAAIVYLINWIQEGAKIAKKLAASPD